MRKMSDNQWRLLEILERSGGVGAGEVEVQWRLGCHSLPPKIARGVVAALVRTLAARGLAVRTPLGYEITEAGRGRLERRRELLRRKSCWNSQ